MRFDPQTITVTDNKDRTYQIDALVAVQDDDTPVGLAVHPVYELGPGPMMPRPGEYTLTHLVSGVRLHRDPVPTESTARRWLELIADLTDWTQSHEALYRLHTLRLQVWVTRIQARWDEEEDRDLFTTQARTHPASLTFSLDALTALIEWMSYGMEYVQITPEAKPALDTLLAMHTELAHQQSAFPHAVGSSIIS
jgi:hypothetical protein